MVVSLTEQALLGGALCIGGVSMETKTIPHARTIDYLNVTVKNEEGARILESLDKYFHQFCAGKECPSCGHQLSGFLGGSFSYSLTHGEGQCSCGWPCRSHHYPKHDGKLVLNRPVLAVLAYHPSIINS
jgi:hypothetical protein